MSQKINQKGLKFYAPLTDKFLQTSVLASDVSAYHNHCSVAHGTPTYSSTGMESDGNNDYLEFPSTGVFNSTEITIAIRFTPDFDEETDTAAMLFATLVGSRYALFKQASANSDVLTLFLGDTLIVNIFPATYGPYWNVDQENTIIITGDDANNLTNIWLNGNQVVTDNSTAWANVDSATLHIAGGESGWGGSVFPGEIRDLMVFDRIWTAEERAAFDACSEGLHAPQKIGSLQKGLVFHAPLTDKYLQTSVLPSDVSAKHNHCDTANGAPTYSSARGVELDGSADYLEFPFTGVLNSTEISFAIRFTPDFDTTVGVQNFFFISTIPYYLFLMQADGGLDLWFNGTVIFAIAPESISPYWNIHEENTIIVVGDDVSNNVDIWLNGTLVGHREIAWTNGNPPSLRMGANLIPASYFDGEIRDFMVWNRLLTADERAILDARTYVNPLYEGLMFYAPLTDDYLEGTGRPSDISSAGNHSSGVGGSPSYSSTGMELNGTSEGAQFPATGIFNSTDKISIAMRLTPDFAHDDGSGYRYICNSFTGSYLVLRNSNSTLSIWLGGTEISVLAAATYGPYWNVGVENTLIIVGDAANNLTNVWLNGTQILTDDPTVWSNINPSTLQIGMSGSYYFDGEIRDFAVWNRLLTANDRAQYENSAEGAII